MKPVLTWHFLFSLIYNEFIKLTHKTNMIVEKHGVKHFPGEHESVLGDAELNLGDIELTQVLGRVNDIWLAQQKELLNNRNRTNSSKVEVCKQTQE